MHGTEVTLTGEVVDSSLKQDAARAVQGIDGVTSVINAIEVLPQSSRDNALRLAEYRAIYSDPSLLCYGDPLDPKIRIIVDHGGVTLEGIVAGEGGKETAQVDANSVPGIVKVNDNLLTQQGVSE